MFARKTLPLFLITAFASTPARAADPERSSEDLGREAHLETIMRLALERNPELAEEAARVASARARADEARRLPDLQLKYEQWGVPLRRPLALREASALMFGLSQTLPAPGTLDARSRVAAEETSGATASEQARRRELRARVRRAYADYYRADRELRLHREHVDLTVRLVELSRASYRAGQRAQQDVLRLGLELSRLHRDLAQIQQERISAQALLNALVNRLPDAPLGPPVELDPGALPPLPPGDASSLQAHRPEVAAATAALRRSEAVVDLARRERRWPSLTIGADYMYMPLMDEPHAYGAMVMLNLPWFSGARRDAIQAGEHAVTADRRALESVRNLLRYQLRDAQARHDAARSTFTIVDQDLLPQAQRNYESAYSSYAAGKGDAIGLVDALRTFLEVRIDRVRALVQLATTAADLARVSGEKEAAR
jgi:cobalt-zinc-cadmium efflux system outer membrane protein